MRITLLKLIILTGCVGLLGGCNPAGQNDANNSAAFQQPAVMTNPNADAMNIVHKM
jgi:hypothetical protein